MNKFLSLLRKLRPRRKPLVLLYHYDGDITLATAHPSQSGWLAQWSPCAPWSLLLPDGKTEGTRIVSGWKPHRDCPPSMTAKS